MSSFRIPNWKRFQHYSHRHPSWIKLHTSILTDRDFCRLPLSAQGLLMQMWVLASENEGVVTGDLDELSFRLHKPVTQEDLKPLLKKFLICIDETGIPLAGASTVLADAIQRRDRGETEEIREEPPLATQGPPEGGKRTRQKFEPPTMEQAKDFFLSKNVNGNEYVRFMAYYDSNGWRVGKNPMRNWKAAAAGWMFRQKEA